MALINKWLNRLMWLFVPLALMTIFAFGTRYLIEHTDGPQHQKLLRHSKVKAEDTNGQASLAHGA